MTFREIAADITDRINTGQYQAGERVPSYTEAANLYSVSVSTAQRVYTLLVDRGVLVGVPGRGLYVAEPTPAST